MVSRLGLAAWVAVTLSGCLVTDPIDFPEPVSYPPSISDAPGGVPIGSTFWIDLGAEVNEWDLPVRIRDDNVEQALAARHRVRTERNPQPDWIEVEIAPSGTPLREYTVKVSSGPIEQGQCHLVELVVSGSFFKRNDPAFFDAVLEVDDLARASWTIWEGRGELDTLPADKAVLIDSCPVEDFPGQSVASEAAP
jgi:hypothetical protein